MWRAPGRRNAERGKFRRLIKKVEAVRLRYGMTKTALAAELETTTDALRAWMMGRTVGRKEILEIVRSLQRTHQEEKLELRDRTIHGP